MWPRIEVTAPLEFPAVYKPDTRWVADGRYQVSFRADCVPDEVRAMMIRGFSKPRLSASSKIATVVEEAEGNYSELARLYAEADIRNISRDRLLSGVEATLTLTIVPVVLSNVNNGQPFLILGLVKVTVLAADIRTSLENACAAYWY